MLCACIDIGSNTTRLLVAEPSGGQLREILAQRAFTRLGKGLRDDGHISAGKIEEVARVVATQVRVARELGADPIRAVATAAIRDASNYEEVCAAVLQAAGVPVAVLSGEEEARLAFVGATKMLGHPVSGEIGVVDVGGGSSEIVVGTLDAGRDLVGVLPDRLGLPGRRLPALGSAVGRRARRGARARGRRLRGP